MQNKLHSKKENSQKAENFICKFKGNRFLIHTYIHHSIRRYVRAFV